MISEKNITRCTFLHRGACMHLKSQQGIQPFKLPLSPLNYLFTDMNTTYIYLQKEAGVSKENYAIALDSCYLFTKKC